MLHKPVPFVSKGTAWFPYSWLTAQCRCWLCPLRLPPHLSAASFFSLTYGRSNQPFFKGRNTLFNKGIPRVALYVTACDHSAALFFFSFINRKNNLPAFSHTWTSKHCIDTRWEKKNSDLSYRVAFSVNPLNWRRLLLDSRRGME